ncbi:hypothetical protein [Flavobacterium gawalongense]|uniref:Uncharacterized protein n=1 Tax=Flavobacterium gawalongense TaxID=2594432 RepID=A0A553BP28_9FLAO|nr:hypothetical protein [Flavobacterium gawalongense]TRX03283.1 hypothetical protein FNW12_15450 [Flavobacterium gawalongense]TRX03891.1 hypothetical protein FNW33_02160 [Flavobacterium gawalongense]TRX07218.1 hypothetical protein FNW10_14820 [Flavobacterium gawalongense]TRX10002.1 hypothetical protein FNW11_08830 [Flavobacterium gawalongense]TRX23274.1 hypothetical protein FNW38_14955 [Flavobacterium gawalongense]
MVFLWKKVEKQSKNQVKPAGQEECIAMTFSLRSYPNGTNEKLNSAWFWETAVHVSHKMVCRRTTMLNDFVCALMGLFSLVVGFNSSIPEFNFFAEAKRNKKYIEPFLILNFLILNAIFCESIYKNALGFMVILYFIPAIFFEIR